MMISFHTWSDKSQTGLTRSHSLGFLLFSYYPIHFVSHFIYGHQSHPQIICHVFTYIHAQAQQAGVVYTAYGEDGEAAYTEQLVWSG